MYPLTFRQLVCLLLFATGLSGCAVPSGAVVLFNEPVHPTWNLKLTPTAWDGHLLRVGTDGVVLGGQAKHRHSMQHVHDVRALPSVENLKPLGIDQVVSGAAHTHRVRSSSITPELTGEASLLPLSYVFYAAVAPHGLFNVPKGTIVGYTGTDIPKGWVRCDGLLGTPDVRGMFIMINNVAPRPSTMGSATHVHDASHSHRWYATTAPADPSMQAFAGDRTSQTNVPQDTALAPVGHSHAATGTDFNGTTGSAPNEPRFVSVSVLMATEHAHMPRGAILPLARGGVPWGWSAFTTRDGAPVVGRFVRTTRYDGLLPVLGGSDVHDHPLNHTHTVTLAPPTTQPVSVAHDDGPAASSIAHTHSAQATYDGHTGPSDALPPFVQLRFIIKD